MYDRMLDDPRLSRWYSAGERRPHAVLRTMTKHLEAILGVPLRTLGLNYYRDGNDSVAWHADRELRELDDTRIAIVTLGARRPFLLRPKGGGRSIDIAPGVGRPAGHGRRMPARLGAFRAEEAVVRARASRARGVGADRATVGR